MKWTPCVRVLGMRTFAPKADTPLGPRGARLRPNVSMHGA